MTILKRIPECSYLDGGFLSYGRDPISSDEDEDRSGHDDKEDIDSGVLSDSDGSAELGEDVGVEFSQYGDRKFLVPVELYDLTDLSGVLSIEAWNDILCEDERFALSEFLPDMDEYTFMRTLKELFSGVNFHFGSPMTDILEKMKGGLLQPQVLLCRQGLDFLQKREHYHFLQKYQNSMVGNLLQIKEAWGNSAGYGIEERIQLLNFIRSRKALVREKDEEVFSPEGVKSVWSTKANSMRLHARRSTLPENFHSQKESDKAVLGVKPVVDSSSRHMGKLAGSDKYVKNQKRILKIVQKDSGRKEHTEFDGYASGLISQTRSVDVNHQHVPPDQYVGYEPVVRKSRTLNIVDNPEYGSYEMSAQPYQNFQKDRMKSDIKYSMLGKKTTFFEKNGIQEDVPIMASKKERPNEVYLREGSSKGFRKKTSLKLHDMEDVERLTVVHRASKGHEIYPEDARIKNRHSAHKNRGLWEDQLNPTRDAGQHMGRGDEHKMIKGNCGDQVVQSPLPQQNFSVSKHHGMQGDSFKFGSSAIFDNQAPKKKRKWKVDDGHHFNNADGALELKIKYSKGLQVQLNDPDEVTSRSSLRHQNFHHRTELAIGMHKQKYDESQEDYTDHLNELTATDDETHSSSSMHSAGEVDVHSSRRMGHNISSTLMPGFLTDRSANDPSRNESLWCHGGVNRSTLLEVDPNDISHVPKINAYSSRQKLNGKIDPRHLSGPRYLNYLDNDPLGVFRGDGDPLLVGGGNETLAYGRNGLEGKRIKTKTDLKCSTGPSTTKHQQHGYESGNIQEHDSHHPQSNVLLKRYHGVEIRDIDNSSHMAFDQVRLQASSNSETVKKKKKKRDKGENQYANSEDEQFIMNDVLTGTLHQVEDVLSKKQQKKKIDAETGFTVMVPPERNFPERVPKKDASQLKLPKSRVLVKPGFSFSIIHLLSSVRTAFINIGVANTFRNYNEKLQKELNGDPDMVPPENSPSISFRDIVSHVNSRPGDPSILKAQEPLQDLVRGVLKIFSAKTAPLGAKGWKPLALYKKAWKVWFWIGPIPPAKSLGHDSGELQTSPEAWGISKNMLVKLVDSYAAWLKTDQETLQQLGSLPAPPASLLTILDEKERFRDLRAQKSLTTINASSDEVRSYFRKEEYLRYTVPDRAFAYTAADGQKSVVAPLRRGGGKPISKARDHFMLKPDRPPHVTVLCLVRDAAARLPGSIGTRADVCTLIRDSQYIVEDVSDAQVNQVVSGALDRLHYERDPCVQFDGDRKLWVYLHRDRDDEDFEDDGTSSTKKWKRQKKEGTGPSDTGPVSYAGYLASANLISKGSAAEYDAADFNSESPVYSANKELADIRTDMVDNEVSFIETQTGIDSVPGVGQNHQMGWEVLKPDVFCREPSIR